MNISSVTTGFHDLGFLACEPLELGKLFQPVTNLNSAQCLCHDRITWYLMH